MSVSTLSGDDDLPVVYSVGQSGHVLAHELVNTRVNELTNDLNDLSFQVANSSSSYSDSDATDAVVTAINQGTHTGITVTRNSVTGAIDLKLVNPVLPLATGAAVPTNTLPGTIILRVG
jgi:hypothetical protein